MHTKLENKRLATCADLMRESERQNRRAADIGTDHGYLAAYLVESGICQTAVAADINLQPLACAAKTVNSHELNGKVDLVLSDGLDSVCPDGITDIICAGMGGELISHILSRHLWIRTTTLILQPMTKADLLRKWLYENGFYIEKECACRDGKFIYAIIRAVYAPERIDYPCDDFYLTVGRISPKDVQGAEYFREKARRISLAAKGMMMGKDSESRIEGERLAALSKKIFEESEKKV